jgi:hypothetical protein
MMGRDLVWNYIQSEATQVCHFAEILGQCSTTHSPAVAERRSRQKPPHANCEYVDRDASKMLARGPLALTSCATGAAIGYTLKPHGSNAQPRL